MYLAEEFSHFEAAVQTKSGGFRRNFFLTLDQYFDFRRKWHGHGMFTTAYRYDQADIRQANMIGNLYIDFDITDIADNFDMVRYDAIKTISAFGGIFGISNDMIRIFFSGNKGIHLVIPAQTIGIHPHPELNMIFKKIADDLAKIVKHGTIDTRIYDKVRLFRIPNTIHPKSGYYKVPITFEELRTLTFDEIQSLAVSPRKVGEVRIQYTTRANSMYRSYIQEWEKEKKQAEMRRQGNRERMLNFTPPCIQHILDNGAEDGKRNHTAAALASYFMQAGLSEDEAADRILAWNANCMPPTDEKELGGTVSSIYRGEHKYGCSRLRDLSICDSSCRLFKKDGGQ